MGKFPDYTGDGAINLLDVMNAPADRKQEVMDIINNKSFTGDTSDYDA